MAFTKSPSLDTYRTVDMEFTATSMPRSGDVNVHRDQEIVNMFFDRNSNENETRSKFLVKRGGLTTTPVSLSKTSIDDQITGYFIDESQNYIYWSTSNKVLRADLAFNIITQIATLGASSTGICSVGFCAFLTSTGTRYICFNTGTELWYHVSGSGTSTKVTDADFPTNTYPTIVFLDGYLFVIKKDTGDIYNSDLDDPSKWTAGNYVTAEINPDTLIAIAKIKNYLIAFGRDGIEFFYDAANVSGSPLARNETYYKAVTLCSNVCTIGDEVFYVGREAGQGLKVFRLDSQVNKPISVGWVNKYLEKFALDTNLAKSDSYGISLINGFAFSSFGHNFYLLSLQNVSGNGTILVCDLEDGFWYRWTFGPEFTQTNAVEAIFNPGLTYQGFPLFAISRSSYWTNMSPYVYNDFGAPFTTSYTTEDYTSDTFNWKTCHRVGLYCDYPDTGGDETYVQVSWSDDDGNTWSTPRNLNVHTNNPFITQCGRFRSRQWRIEYSDNYPFRMWGLSMDLNLGNI